MSADDFLARVIPGEPYDLVLRLYRWEPPAVSLGFHQRVEVVDAAEVARRGWELVRRPTGGRALLHKGDLSYAAVVRSEEGSAAAFQALLAMMSRVFEKVFKRLGIPCPDDEGQPAVSAMSRLRSGLCLSTRVRGEVRLGGYKVAASAQRLYRQSLLQHGSILLEGDAGEIAGVANLPPPEREAAAEQLRQRAAALAQVTGAPVTRPRLQAALVDAFAEVFDAQTFETGWTRGEQEAIIENSHRFLVLAGDGEVKGAAYA